MNTLTKTAFILIILFFARMHAYGQVSLYTVSLSDSLVADKKNPILYNVLSITNTSNQVLNLSYKVTIPNTWIKLSPANTDDILSIPAGHTEHLAVNLARGRNGSASWQVVDLVFQNISNGQSTHHKFHIREAAIYTFKTERITEDLSFVENPGTVRTGLYISNTGNCEDAFSVVLKSRNIDVFNKKVVTLKPGKDTTVFFDVKLSDAQWRNLSKEIFNVSVAGNGNSSTLQYELYHTRNTVKVYKSAYEIIPVSVMAGAVANNTEVSYNWGFNSQFKLGDHSFSAFYRSKQFGNNVAGNIQRGVFSVGYGYKNWYASYGILTNIQNFFAVGDGVKVGYMTHDREFSVTGIKHSKRLSIFHNDNISSLARYSLGKIELKHVAEMNINKQDGINGYILENSAKIINKKNTRLIVKGGVGIEENTNDVPSHAKIQEGYSAGYDFNVNKKHWQLVSSADYRSPNYPGIRKGMSVQTHFLDWKITDKAYFGLEYSTNYIKRNYFRDSIYNTDLLSYNNTRTGIRTGYISSKHNAYLGTGIFKNTGQKLYNLDRYFYGDASYSFRTKGSGQIALNSRNTFTGSGQIITSISNISFNNYHGGVQSTYVRTINTDGNLDLNNVSDLSYSETVNACPYVNFRFFRKTLSGSVRYNISKSLYEDNLKTGVGADINYIHPKIGTSVALGGYVPFQHRTVTGLSYTESKYGSLTVMQPIGIPIITHRKYYDFKIALYNDENGNGIRDANEGPLNNVLVDLNDQSMITDANGQITLKNTRSGQYNVGLYKAKREGLIPVNGSDVNFDLTSNTNLELAFKKGRVISGRAKIVEDALKGGISQQFIKIIATDSAGRKYTTLTDEEGNFYIYVPSGIFDVSLNPDAFSSDIKPVRVSFTADIDANENAFVCFELKQKKREVRFLNQNLTNNEDKKPKETAATVKPAATIPPPPPKVEAPKPAPQPLAKIDMKPIGAIANTLATTAAPLAGIAIATTPVEQILARAEHMDPLEALGKPLAVTLDKPEAAAATLAVVEEQPVKAEKGQWAPRRSVIRN